LNNRRKLVIALGVSALAAPLASLAQVPAAKLVRIGLLGPGLASGASWATGLVANLRDLGYVEGTNLRVESRWAEGRSERLAELVCREFSDADAMVEGCLADAVAFSAERGHDDLTVVVICRNTPARLPADATG